MTAQKVAEARAAAEAAGFENPGPATIALYANDPYASAADVVKALAAIAPEVDSVTVAASLEALIAEAKANTTSAQLIDVINKIAAIALPLATKAVGV